MKDGDFSSWKGTQALQVPAAAVAQLDHGADDIDDRGRPAYSLDVVVFDLSSHGKSLAALSDGTESPAQGIRGVISE